MRKFFLYLLATIVLASCDNLKKKDKTDGDDEEVTTKKKKKALDEDEESADDETPKKKKVALDDEDADKDETNGDDDNDDNNADYADGWTSTEKNKFLKECVANVPENVSAERGKAYCSCFLQKVENKFPSYTEANAKMTQTELADWAAECNRQ